MENVNLKYFSGIPSLSNLIQTTKNALMILTLTEYENTQRSGSSLKESTVFPDNHGKIFKTNLRIQAKKLSIESCVAGFVF